MNKFFKSLICILCASLLFLISCTSKSNEEKREESISPPSTTEEDTITTTDENTKSDGTTSTPSSKQTYLNKLNALESDLNVSLKEKYNGTTIEMNEAASEEYEKWDDMLNEIYSKLKEQLLEEEMNKLTEVQLKWIETRDQKSEIAANEFEGGTMAPLNKLMSLISSTKERCYELVNEYMQ